MAEVVVEREIAASREIVFAMFTNPKLVVQWLGDSAELDPTPGGLFRFTLGDRDACRGRYVELDPPRRLVFTWGWERAEAIPVLAGSTVVEVELETIEGGTRLRLTHRGLDGDAAALHEHGWTRFLARLQATVAGMDPGADPWDEDPDQIAEQIRQEH